MANGLPEDLREFDDADKARKLIYSNTLDSLKRRFPIEDPEYRLELHNPRYDGPQDFTMEQQKRALMTERQLRTPIKGMWRLVHKPTNQVVEEREDVVMHVPYLTGRNTFIYGGNELSIVNQSRLKPGIYTRRRKTGEVESQFNVKPGTGRGFHIRLEPETGLFKLSIGQSNVPLVPLLKVLGVSDKDMINSWGAELYEKNIAKSDPKAIEKIYERFSGYKYDPKLSDADKHRFIAENLTKFELDPDVVARTLGIPDTKGVTPQTLIRATQKLLNVSRGEESTDDRDSTIFSNIYSVEDLIQERIDKDAGKLAKTLLFKARRSKSLKPIARGALDGYIFHPREGLLLGSGLAMPLEETNPLHVLEQANRITKLGVGGIGSAEAITDEARNVNNSQLGFVDPICGPEGCHPRNAEVMTRTGWVRWDSVNADTEFACLIDNKLEYRKAETLHTYPWDGTLYGVKNRYVSYLVTPKHRIWTKAYHSKQAAYHFESADHTHTRMRILQTGGHGGYVGTKNKDIQLQFDPLTARSIPDYFFDADIETREQLLYTICQDISIWSGGTFTYSTPVKQLALDVERLAFSLGYSVNVHSKADSRDNATQIWYVQFYQTDERLVTNGTKVRKSHYYTEHYKGKVYCATVPGGLMYCRYGDYGGHWSGNTNIGIDIRAAYKTFKGKDKRMYGEFKVPGTDQPLYLPPEDVSSKVVAFPGEMARPGSMAVAMVNGEIKKVPKTDVQLEIPSFAHMMSSHVNLNPLPTAVQPGRQFYGAKFWSQYMPLVEGEVPLVDTLAPDGKQTFTEYYGRKVGTITAKAAGTVVKVSPDAITVAGDDGKTEKIELVKDFPFNRISGLSYFPAVEPGTRVNVGDMLAHSNFTDKKTGAISLGRNLKTAIIPARGQSVSGDTNILSVMPDGTCTFGPIRDLQSAKDVKTYALATDPFNGKQLKIHSYMVHEADSELREVITVDGMRVKATLSHSFVTLSDAGDSLVPIKTDDIVKGSTFIPVIQPVLPHSDTVTNVTMSSTDGNDQEITVQLDGTFGMVVGLYLARGRIIYLDDKPHSVSISCVEEGTIEYLQQWCTAHGIAAEYSYITTLHEGCHGSVVIHSVALASWFSRCSRDNGDKQLPDVVWTAHKSFAEGLISGYWVGGSVNSSKQCDAFASSIVLADGLCLLLGSMGIRATHREYPTDTHYARPTYCIHVYREYTDRIPIPRNCLPAVKEVCQQGLAENTYASRAMLKNIYTQVPEVLQRLIDAPVWWDIVQDIVPCPDEPYVYDLDMRPLSNFAVGSGWIVHNSFEDAYVISESAAKKLATERLYGYDQDSHGGVDINKNKFISSFPRTYTKDQIDKLDDKGVAKPGTILNKGDPIILATGPKLLTSADAQLGKLHKVLRDTFTDKSVTWDNVFPGIVTDAVVTAGGARVNVKSTPPVSVGDKLCYDKETEVLTATGWKSFSELTLTDMVAALDPVTHKFEYMAPVSLQSFAHSGRMYKLATGNLDLLVTDNHNLCVQLEGSTELELIPATRVFGRDATHKKNGKWHGTSAKCVELPGIGAQRSLVLPINTYMQLLGLFLSNGTCFSRSASDIYRLDLVCSKHAVMVELITALEAAGCKNICAVKGGKYQIYDVRLWMHFSQVYAVKHIPDWVFTLPPTTLKLLFDWLMGDIEFCSGACNYLTLSSKLADDIQRLCLHIGYAADIAVKRSGTRQVCDLPHPVAACHCPCFVVHITTAEVMPTVSRNHSKSKRQRFESWVDYTGQVYCCTLPKWHVLYVRRNGKAVWCGNSTRHGLKGVVGKIVPDDKMPRDLATDEPYELLLNPMGILSRVAPNQIIEMSLGKLAKKTGKPVRLPQLPPPEGWQAWAEKQLKDAGVSDVTDLFDPDTGKTIKSQGDGHVYVSAFHHLAEKKLSHRGEQGAYTIDEQPAKGGVTGAKRFGMMDSNAALAHGATDVIKDAITIRGTKNEDFWKALKLGRPLPEPTVPFIYDKFLNTLKAGGINIADKGNSLSLLPMTDKDIDALTKGAIKSSDMITSDFEPIKDGLFDMGVTGGMNGNRWSHIELNEPVPNPVMEEPVRRLLGLTGKQLRNVLAGSETVNGLSGGRGLKEALQNIDIDAEIAKHMDRVKRLRGANRDNSVKILGYLTAAKKQGVHPSDWVISKIPVIPPVFRPIARMGDMALKTDLNELYRDLIETNNSILELRKDLPETAIAAEKLNLYDATAAAFGLGDPITAEGQSRRVKGAIAQIIGTNPKHGLFQSKVLAKTVSGVGRGVVTPDPNLDMDSIGIPEDSAWTLYKDFVMRRLVRKGFPALRALELVDKRSPEAREMLDEEMQARPVIMNRAPTWHKFNLLAFYPHVVEGHVIRVSPLIVKGMNMDFDGDQANFHVPISDKAVEQTRDKMLPSKNLFSLTDLRSIRHAPSMEMTLGLYQLTREASKKPPVKFASIAEAQKAYQRGEIGLNDPIIVA